MKSRNPSWEHRLYDDTAVETFIRDRYGPEVLGRYLQIDPAYGAARADLFRYLLMYDVGGVYLDVKSTATQPLDNVLRPDDRFILSHWPNVTASRYFGTGHHPELSHIERGEFQQWFIICAPGHPFLRAVIGYVLENIDEYLAAAHNVGRHAAVRVTGPVAYTLAILPLLAQHPFRLVESGETMGLQYTIYPEETAHRSAFSMTYHEQQVPLAISRGDRQLRRAIILAARAAVRKLRG